MTDDQIREIEQRAIILAKLDPLILQLERDAVNHSMAARLYSRQFVERALQRLYESRAALVNAIRDEIDQKVKHLRADIERIGRERDQMIAANVELQERLSRLEDDGK